MRAMGAWGAGWLGVAMLGALLAVAGCGARPEQGAGTPNAGATASGTSTPAATPENPEAAPPASPAPPQTPSTVVEQPPEAPGIGAAVEMPWRVTELPPPGPISKLGPIAAPELEVSPGEFTPHAGREPDVAPPKVRAMLAPPLETASPESPLPPMPSPPMAPAPPVESLAPIEPPPAIEPPVVEPPPTAASARAAANEEPYQIVTVFYGTDRAVVEPLQANQPAYSHWFSLTAACAGLTMLLSALMFRFAQSRTLKALTGLGAAATVVLGLVTTQANWPANPAEPQPGRVYGSGRGSLEMGTCQVSIPRRHEVGKLESPSVFRFEFHADPARHVVLLDARQEPADAFYAGLRTRVAKSRRKEALVFVHGYNVTFETAARRTAQLAYDLQFDGAAIFFSWPSQGTLLGYPVDETNAAWTAPHLKQFLLEVAERSGAESVHLIAHSMGNRALTAALQSIAYERKDRLPMFREVVLTAPDIDADMFQRDIAPAIVGTADRVTLYASSNDEALILSKQFHGYARAGDSGPGLVVVPGVDTIDVSTVDTSLTGHFYYGSNGTVLADLVELLGEAKPPPARRFLQPMSLGHLTYWVFQTNRSTASALALPPSGRL